MLAAQPLLKKYFPAPTTPQPQSQTAPAQPAAAAAAATPAGKTPGAGSRRAVSPVAASPAPEVTKQATSETDTVIENDLYRITFTNRGAQVKSWILKKFDNDEQNGPLDLVNQTAAAKYGYPLSLWTYDEALRNKLSSALYVVVERGQADGAGEHHV